MPDRDKIPEPVKRAVRQRCGFGCVICGMPIYVYDHIVEHSRVLEHNESNLTLLCDNHHRSKTARKISLEQIRSFNTNPINKNSSISRTGEQLFFSGDKIKMQLAGTWFFASLIPPDYRFDAIIVNERPLLSFHVDDGNLLLDIEGHDEMEISSCLSAGVNYVIRLENGISSISA
jgi:hypothetical protein